MKTIVQTYKISASIDRVWQAFVDPNIINEWGADPAVMSDTEQAAFSLWGGDIHGTNTKVIKHEILAQDWYSGDKWAQASRVTFVFKNNGSSVEVHLTHENIPDADFEDIDQGWKDYYLGPIKDLLEDKQ